MTKVRNLTDTAIVVTFTNEYDGTTNYKKKGEPDSKSLGLKAHEKKDIADGVVYNYVHVRIDDSMEKLWEERISTPEERSTAKDTTSNQKTDPKKKPDVPQPEKKAVALKTVVKDFHAHLDSIPFYCADSITADSATLQKHFDMLSLESVDTKGYIEEQHLNALLSAMTDTIESYKTDTTLIASFIRRYADASISDSVGCIDSLRSILSARVAMREAMLTPLRAELGNAQEEEPAATNWKAVAVCVGIALLIVGLMLWYYLKNQSDKRLQNNKRHTTDTTDSDATPTIQLVSTRKAAPMRKQSLDDVYDNAAYLKIETADFCAESAVRNIYIKNSCIKDIYNMYANDLRNPDNPNEDGCMVLGRWVLDEATQTYDVSLEEIVRPGDDAVFAEYELNFGTKIGLKRSERLRKLRNETGLQYDLTCWVHSHPGLGVFFSNADNNVHLLLKHHAHPHFLTAMVIDILTPQQETGIFTFKRDGAVTSKDDLKRMYSLEEMYRWALDSERRSFDANDYYNTLGTIQFHHNECYGIQLSNGAIIDMTFLTSKPNGFICFVQGFTIMRGERTECIVAAVTKNEKVADNEMVGCFVVTTYCSIPSIRKAVSRYLQGIRFVLVYTTTDGLLTSIPVINGELVTSDSYYGQQKLEDLKIWTRRRR